MLSFTCLRNTSIHFKSKSYKTSEESSEREKQKSFFFYLAVTLHKLYFYVVEGANLCFHQHYGTVRVHCLYTESIYINDNVITLLLCE